MKLRDFKIDNTEPMVLMGGMLMQDTHGSFRVIAIRFK